MSQSLWKAVTSVAVIMGTSCWAAAQETKFTVKIKPRSSAEMHTQARDAGATYIAPELMLMKSLDANVELVGVTRSGASVYRASTDAMERMRSSRLPKSVQRGAEDDQPIKLIVGYRNQTKETVQGQLRRRPSAR